MQEKKIFTIENAQKIQGCINCINKWKSLKLLQDGEYEILVASLIQSFDKVANTAGTYYAYLKEYYRKAKNPFKFSFLHPISGMEGCRAYLGDAKTVS